MDHHHQLVLHQHHLSQQQQQAPPRPPTQRSRLGGGLRTTPGEIVEVQGGHIVRSTGRKDRHSKVCTAKGPRDRRVRLSAHTAIQFYDVQDRLGYDRPSKAVDWLIENAKAAIDELAELPAWRPTASFSNPPAPPREPVAVVDSSKKPMAASAGGGSEPGASSHYGFGGGGGGSSSFLPASLDCDAIADTIKSFFPTAAATSAAAPSTTQPTLGYHNYPPDLLSRTSSHSQDLRLSLQSLQEPIYHHHHTQPGHHALFSGSHNVAAAYDTAAAAASSMPQWNVADPSGGGGDGGGGGFMFSVPPPPQAVPLHSMLGSQGQFFTQRGPLQSSYPPFARAWVDPIPASASEQQQQQQHSMHPMMLQYIGFASSGSSSGAFSGFRIPARIQGEEEHHDGGGSAPDKPSSASSGSHH